jgi:hypothetical protein
MKWVYAKEIKTERFHVMPGEPLLDRHSSSLGRKYAKQKYGADCMALVDFRDPATFLKIIGADNPKSTKEAYGKLKLLCDEQSKRIAELEGMIRTLDRDVRKAGGTPSVSLKQEKHDA